MKHVESREERRCEDEVAELALLECSRKRVGTQVVCRCKSIDA